MKLKLGMLKGKKVYVVWQFLNSLCREVRQVMAFVELEKIKNLDKQYFL